MRRSQTFLNISSVVAAAVMSTIPFVGQNEPGNHAVIASNSVGNAISRNPANTPVVPIVVPAPVVVRQGSTSSTPPQAASAPSTSTSPSTASTPPASSSSTATGSSASTPAAGSSAAPGSPYPPVNPRAAFINGDADSDFNSTVRPPLYDSTNPDARPVPPTYYQNYSMGGGMSYGNDMAGMGSTQGFTESPAETYHNFDPASNFGIAQAVATESGGLTLPGAKIRIECVKFWNFEVTQEAHPRFKFMPASTIQPQVVTINVTRSPDQSAMPPSCLPANHSPAACDPSKDQYEMRSDFDLTGLEKEAMGSCIAVDKVAKVKGNFNLKGAHVADIFLTWKENKDGSTNPMRRSLGRVTSPVKQYQDAMLTCTSTMDILDFDKQLRESLGLPEGPLTTGFMKGWYCNNSKDLISNIKTADKSLLDIIKSQYDSNKFGCARDVDKSIQDAFAVRFREIKIKSYRDLKDSFKDLSVPELWARRHAVDDIAALDTGKNSEESKLLKDFQSALKNEIESSIKKASMTELPELLDSYEALLQYSKDSNLAKDASRFVMRTLGEKGRKVKTDSDYDTITTMISSWSSNHKSDSDYDEKAEERARALMLAAKIRYKVKGTPEEQYDALVEIREEAEDLRDDFGTSTGYLARIATNAELQLANFDARGALMSGAYAAQAFGPQYGNYIAQQGIMQAYYPAIANSWLNIEDQCGGMGGFGGMFGGPFGGMGGGASMMGLGGMGGMGGFGGMGANLGMFGGGFGGSTLEGFTGCNLAQSSYQQALLMQRNMQMQARNYLFGLNNGYYNRVIGNTGYANPINTRQGYNPGFNRGGVPGGAGLNRSGLAMPLPNGGTLNGGLSGGLPSSGANPFLYSGMNNTLF